MRRLSDVREDDAPVDFDVPPGDLDALLPSLPEAEEPEPGQPGFAPALPSLQHISTQGRTDGLSDLLGNLQVDHCRGVSIPLWGCPTSSRIPAAS